MEISASSSDTTSLAAAAQQMQANLATQVEMLKEIAQAQMEVAAMLTDLGIGGNLDVSG
ncbi:MAG: hypothetical protein JXR89_00135 [Deltaproteobacteria bacterium]|nr:hypothetical protein [Deltaproteobacteria bacterium]